MFGHTYYFWEERRYDDSFSFSTEGIIEITGRDIPSILKKTKDILCRNIAQRKIEETFTSGSRPGHGVKMDEIGGTWKGFHGEFFSEDPSNKELVKDLNGKLKGVLEEVFSIPA